MNLHSLHTLRRSLSGDSRFRGLGLSTFSTTFFALLLLGCGAKTGLRVPTRDAMAPRDVTVLDAADVVDVPSPPVDVQPTYLGTEFYAVSTSNSNLPDPNPFSFAIAVGNPSNVSVDVVVTGGGLLEPLMFSVAAGGTSTQSLPWVKALSNHSVVYRNCGVGCCDAECCEGGGREAESYQLLDGAYRIRTTNPVTIYQFNPLEYQRSTPGCDVHSFTNDASLLLPTSAIADEYLVLSHGKFSGGSFITVVGTTEAPTHVTISLTATTVAGSGPAPFPEFRAGQTVERTLARGEVLQLITPRLGDDLTGSVVRADHPVTVFAGVDCTNMSPDGTLGACDHLEEQLFPVSTWGSEVVVSALHDRGPNERSMLRVMASRDQTILRFTPSRISPPRMLQRGQIFEFETAEDVLINANAPILVAEFMEGQQSTPGAMTGDPAMVLEVPTRQFRRDYVFVVPASYTTNFLQITAPQDAVVTIDGNTLVSGRSFVDGAPWTVWRTRIAAGSHRVATSSPLGVGIKVIGIAPYTSYMYPGGLDLSR
jgi:hypothetical protein